MSKIRNYQSALEKALMPDNVPVEVYENLIKTTRENLKGLHKYVALRKDILGVDELRQYDMSVSLVNDVEAQIPYEKAYEINPNLENIVTLLKNEINEPDEVDMSDFTDEANELIQKGIEYKNENKLWDSLDCLMKAVEVDSTCESQVGELIDEIKAVFEREFVYGDEEFDIKSKADRIKMQAMKALIKENNPEKALTLMDLALELNENDVNTLNHKGGVLFICSEYQKAIECFDRCLSIDNDYTCALFNKAIVLRLMNKLPEALTCFDELLKMPQNYNKVKPYQLEILDKLHTGAIT